MYRNQTCFFEPVLPASVLWPVEAERQQLESAVAVAPAAPEEAEFHDEQTKHHLEVVGKGWR